MAATDGKAAIRTTPWRPATKSSNSANTSWYSFIEPAGQQLEALAGRVRRSLRVSRSNRRVPNLPSICWMVRLSAGCDIPAPRPHRQSCRLSASVSVKGEAAGDSSRDCIEGALFHGASRIGNRFQPGYA